MAERAPVRRLFAAGAVAGAVAVIASAAPRALHAQRTIAELAGECGGPILAIYPAMDAHCTDAALALAATRAGVGLALSQGSAVPGSGSTLGRRMASSPRIALSLRGAVSHAPYPDPGAFAARADDRTFQAGTLEGSVAVGLLEGWSLMPTVGGFLSLDLVASAGLVGLSDDDGFHGSVEELGYGARVGILRESFTLPGLTASLARRHASEVEWGRTTGDGARVTFKPVVTSVRLTAAKDLLAMGVLAGWGWDRYGGASAMTVRRTLAGVTQTGQAESDDFRTDRQLLFGGLSYTILVFQLAAEGGWARGFDGPDGSAGWDAGSGSLFGSVAARLTY